MSPALRPAGVGALAVLAAALEGREGAPAGFHHITSRGLCLERAARAAAHWWRSPFLVGASPCILAARPCDPGSGTQRWYVSGDAHTASHIKMNAGACLDVDPFHNRYVFDPWVSLNCDERHSHLRWTMAGGTIRFDIGACISMPDRRTSDGLIRLVECNSTDPNQHFELVTLTATTATTTLSRDRDGGQGAAEQPPVNLLAVLAVGLAVGGGAVAAVAFLRLRGGPPTYAALPAAGAGLAAAEEQERVLMFSGRFCGDATEALIRQVHRHTPEDVRPYIVEAGVGDNFGPLTMVGLARAYAMVAFCSQDPPYGKKTASPFSSYHELEYWLQNQQRLRLIAVQLDDVFPPTTGEIDGTAQNAFAFRGDLVRINGRNKGARQLAAEIAAAARQLPR